jgi:hypothetical protein
MVASALPPYAVCIPNHPVPTNPRAIVATFAPLIPNALRHSTGYPTPYFVPAYPFAAIGASTSAFPTHTLANACRVENPIATTDDASVHAGTHTTNPIHSAAMSYVPNVRSFVITGPRSSLMSLSLGSRGRLGTSSTTSVDVHRARRVASRVGGCVDGRRRRAVASRRAPWTTLGRAPTREAMLYRSVTSLPRASTDDDASGRRRRPRGIRRRGGR